MKNGSLFYQSRALHGSCPSVKHDKKIFRLRKTDPNFCSTNESTS